jgi:hypothetical protein
MTHTNSTKRFSYLTLDGIGELYLFNYLFMDYLTTFSVAQATWRRVTGLLMSNELETI